MPAPMPCPCGRPLTYAACCGRWHAGPTALAAPDAEALMRSRYSAYALGLAPYLLQTWHPSTRPAQLQLHTDERWLGLRVIRHERLDADHARVAFVARSKRTGVAGGRAHRLVELSRFERLDGRWYYVDGDLAADTTADEHRPPGRRASSD